METSIPFWRGSRGRRAGLGATGLLLVLALGCAQSAPGTQPDAMGAEAHRQEAPEHDREGREHERRYDARARSPYDEHLRYPQEFEAYNPTAVYLRLAREHRSHARQHVEAARFLEEFEEAECSAFPPESRIVCPLLGHVDAVEDIPGGVRVRLEEGVPTRAALAHMRCHLGFARARGRAGMEECPLYLRGVRVEPVADSKSIDLLVASPDALEELRLRAHVHSHG